MTAGRIRWLATGVGLALLLAAAPATAQCAMCRTGLESPEAAALAAGLRHGILLLLPIPFALVLIIGQLFRSARRPESEPDESRDRSR